MNRNQELTSGWVPVKWNSNIAFLTYIVKSILFFIFLLKTLNRSFYIAL